MTAVETEFSGAGPSRCHTELYIRVQAVKAYCYADALPLSPGHKRSAAARTFNEACPGHSIRDVESFITTCYENLQKTGSVQEGGSSRNGAAEEPAGPSSRGGVSGPSSTALPGNRAAKRSGEQAKDITEDAGGGKHSKKRRVGTIGSGSASAAAPASAEGGTRSDQQPPPAAGRGRKRKLSEAEVGDTLPGGVAQASKVRVRDPLEELEAEEGGGGPAPPPPRSGVRKRKAGGLSAAAIRKRRRPAARLAAKRRAELEPEAPPSSEAGGALSMATDEEQQPPPLAKAVKRMRLA